MLKFSTISILSIIISFILVACNDSQSIHSTEVANTNANLTSISNSTNQNDENLTNTNENQTSITNDNNSTKITENQCTVENKGLLTFDDVKDDFKNNYPDATIISKNKIGDQYLLIEYLYEFADSANMFTLYDLKTGARNDLPSTGFYSELMQITDENNISLLSTGKNSEVNTIYFPSILNFHRDGNNLDFTTKIEIYFASVEQRIVFGDDSMNEVIYSIKQNSNGIDVYFKPLPGKDAQENFMLSESIPLTATSYDMNNKQFTISFSKTSIDNDLIIEKSDSGYYTSLNITDDSDNYSIVIDLKDNTKLYNAEVETITDASVCLKITFK